MAKKTPARKSAKADGDSSRKSSRDRIKIAADDLPRRTLTDALVIPRTLHETFGGKSATWEEIAQTLEISPTNANNKYPLWAALAYGIIKKEADGSFSLAEKGRKLLSPNYDGEDAEARLQAIQTPAILNRFYADYNGSPVPADEHLLNVLENRYGIPRDRRQEAAELILDNARLAGILQEANGRRSISIGGSATPTRDQLTTEVEPGIDAAALTVTSDFEKVCFIITPIGSDDSEQRRHADLVLKHLVTPVLKEIGLEPIRADKIAKPGLITQQVIEHLAKSRLCIADLSFNNPNAFYEIGVRHTFRLPSIQIIRTTDQIPFDVSQGRTVKIDTSDVYTIMDKFASARAELTEYVNAALGSPAGDSRDNPISYYLPGLKVHIPS